MDTFPQYRAISGLNILIKTHTRRARHYRAAAIKTNYTPLQNLFRKYANHSQKTITTLLAWMVNYGGPSYLPISGEEEISVWQRIGRFFNTTEVNELLHKSEAMERYALRVHREAINLSVIPAATASDIQAEIKKCEEAFATIKMLQEKGVNEILVTY